MMSQSLVVAQSGAMPVEPKEAFDGVFWMDVPTVFGHWYGPHREAGRGCQHAFAPSGTGTTATWQWTLHPRSAFTKQLAT